MVSQERVSGHWNDVMGAVREKFGEISGDELQRVRGNVEQLVGLLQQRTGKTREQIESFIDGCCSSTASSVERASEAATDYANRAGEVVRENYDRWSAEAQRGYDYSVHALRRRPLESVAIALGAGLLAGLMVGLSMSGRRR